MDRDIGGKTGLHTSFIAICVIVSNGIAEVTLENMLSLPFAFTAVTKQENVFALCSRANCIVFRRSCLMIS